MITYYDLGPNKKLNEIVMAGSHDAGITQGASNVQTQDLDILGQANAGVRIFDIRITGAIVKKGPADNVVALKAFHGGASSTKTTGIDLRTNQTTEMKTGLKYGEYGMTLSKILNDSKKFVTQNNTEFLLLKFDKCSN